jgi:ParB-like chromosome segregation protein Spo0J
MKTRTVKVEDLLPDPKNARKHSGRNLEAVVKSLAQFGAARSVVLDKDGIVRAGNGTLAAAKMAGIEKVVVVKGDSKTLIAVEREDWTEEEAAGYALADNRTAELAQWDKDVLREVMAGLEGGNLEATGFTKEELEQVLAEGDGVQLSDEVVMVPVPNTICPKCGFKWHK